MQVPLFYIKVEWYEHMTKKKERKTVRPDHDCSCQPSYCIPCLQVILINCLSVISCPLFCSKTPQAIALHIWTMNMHNYINNFFYSQSSSRKTSIFLSMISNHISLLTELKIQYLIMKISCEFEKNTVLCPPTCWKTHLIFCFVNKQGKLSRLLWKLTVSKIMGMMIKAGHSCKWKCF